MSNEKKKTTVGVDARSPVGHWEVDTVIGRNHKYVFVTLVERRTGYGIVRKVKTRNADGIATAIIDALGPLKTLKRTLTLGNCLEFAKHEAITAALGVSIYSLTRILRGSAEQIKTEVGF